MASERSAHDLVKPSTHFLVCFSEIGHEAVIWREVVHCNCYDIAYGGEGKTVCGCAGLEAFPGGRKGWTVDMSVYPVTVLKVVGYQFVDGWKRGEEIDEVLVVFDRSHELVCGGVILACMSVTFCRVPAGVVLERGSEQTKEGWCERGNTTARWVTAAVGPA